MKDKDTTKFEKDEQKPYKGKRKGSGKKRVQAHDRSFNKSRRYDSVSTDTATNSVDWYIVNDQMLKDAASIQFYNSLGNYTKLDSMSRFYTNYGGPTNVGYNNTTRLDASVPGVMAINYVPTIGRARDNSDPVNIAARNVYAFVRKANSGSKNYDSPNLMMYLMACDSIYTFYQWMVRLYGLLCKFSSYNKYYHRAILQAMNVDESGFQGHISDLRAYINQFALRANSLCVPNTFTIYKRHMYLVAGLFKDTAALKSQIYLFNPDYIYKYEDTQGTLEPVALGRYGTMLDFVSVRSIGETLLNAILTSEDMAIMKGDILKAFGEGGIYSLPTIDENVVTMEVHDYEILTQIQAANFLGPIDINLNNNLVIKEDTTPGSQTEGALLQSVTAAWTVTNNNQVPVVPTGNLGTILNMYVDNPTPADVMVASRLSHFAVPYIQGDASSATIYNTAEYFGTEVCTTYSIYVLGSNGNPGTAAIGGVSEFTNGAGDAIYGKLAALLSPFEWHPVLHWANGTPTLGATPTFTFSYQGAIDLDWDNYAILDVNNLEKLHECATFGEFRVPQLGVMM